MKIEVGAKIRKTPTIGVREYGRHSEMFYDAKDLEGTIVDVNRKHRHYTVEYEFPRGKFRETFKMERAKAVGVHRWGMDK